MKKYLGLLALAIIISQSAFAADKTSRKGFFLDVAPVIGYEYNQLERFGGGLSLQLGGGVNEQLILMGTLQSFATSINDVTFSVGQMMFKAQYFPVKQSDFYMTGGIGYAVAQASTSGSGGSFSASSNPGLTLEGGAGYQFRTGKKFYIAPEVTLNYSNIESEAVVVSAVALRLGWYFWLPVNDAYNVDYLVKYLSCRGASRGARFFCMISIASEKIMIHGRAAREPPLQIFLNALSVEFVHGQLIFSQYFYLRFLFE